MKRTDHLLAEQGDRDVRCMPAHRAHRRVLGGGICGLLRLALILLAMPVRFDPATPDASLWEGRDHYQVHHPASTSRHNQYVDTIGNPVGRGSNASHIPPMAGP